MELLILQLFFPPVLGYLATTKGYKFWTWASIGFFVPVISIFILFALKSKKVEINEADLVIHVNTDKVLYRKE